MLEPGGVGETIRIACAKCRQKYGKSHKENGCKKKKKKNIAASYDSKLNK